jgi:hypothetical protein
MLTLRRHFGSWRAVAPLSTDPAASACAPKYLGLDAPRRHAPDREAIELFLETLTDEGRSAALSQEILTTAVEIRA